MILVRTNNLVKYYGRVGAVFDLSLTIEKSSITGLVGPNGAGKTTTIKIILGFLRPTEGKVSVFGSDPWNNSEIRRKIGVVHENASFPQHEIALHYLKKACRIFGQPESRCLEVLKLVDLPEARDRTIRALSAGMLQKFAIAHALVNHPELIVADEMTSNLDPEARNSVLELTQQLNRDEDTTFLLSSHILPELDRVCDSVAIITQGHLREKGKLRDLYEKYAIGLVRIDTDKPEEVFEAVEKIPFVRSVRRDFQAVFVHIDSNDQDKLSEKVQEISTMLNAKIYGINTGLTSIEDLYRAVTGPRRMRSERRVS